MFFGTKSHYTILSNYVTIFEVDAEMSEVFTDFSREKSQKNSAHWLQWVRNYWYLHFSPKLVMFLQGVTDTRNGTRINGSYTEMFTLFWERQEPNPMSSFVSVPFSVLIHVMVPSRCRLVWMNLKGEISVTVRNKISISNSKFFCTFFLHVFSFGIKVKCVS